MTKKTRRGFCACNTVCFRCCCRHLHLPSLLYSHKVLPPRSTFVLYGDVTDGAASEAVSVDSSVNDLVFSVVRDALAKGMPSEDVMLDAAMDNLMWSMLHDAISGRAARESENLADALDDMITCLLHDAFFGPEASKTVSVWPRAPTTASWWWMAKSER